MVNLGEITSRCRTQHEHLTSTRWSDDHIHRLVNEGLESLAEYTHFYERYTTIDLLPYRTFYDIRGFTPETPLSITSAWSDNRQEWLHPGNPEHLPYDWEEATGEPQIYFTRGIYMIGFWPHPGSSVSSKIKVHFAAMPGKWTSTQSVLYELPDNYIPALEYYVLSEMALIDKAHSRSIRLYKRYLTLAKGFRMQTKTRLVDGHAGSLMGP